MIRKIRQFIPNSLVNYGKHLPTAVLANLKYGFPSRKMTVIGVTGTDGKTTTVNMIYEILRMDSRFRGNDKSNVAMISSINAVLDGKEYDTGFHTTSPSPFQLQKYIKMAKKAGVEILVLEVTSHGLAQFRNWGIKFDIGVITNITHEHLDYHGSWENYFKTKAKLLKNVRVAIVNHDEGHFTRLAKLTKGQLVSFGLHKGADFNPRKFPLNLKIPGDFNLLNALAASAVCVNLGIDSKRIRQTLANFSLPSGRMEEIENNRGLKIVIDFAHTPNALENALKTLRRQTKERLISVFGCASERDVQKRSLMGAVSGKLADITVLTDEDPRFEDPIKIIDKIAEGAYKCGAKDGENLFKEPDRQKAIKLAIEMAKKGDVVGIFGKGHEKSMNYQGVEKPWSDREAVLKAL